MNEKLSYPNSNQEPMLGDIVKIEAETLQVEDIINSKEKQKEWGVSENGLMLVGGVYGRIFENLKTGSEVQFIQAKKEKPS